jgi:hypothetical protein
MELENMHPSNTVVRVRYSVIRKVILKVIFLGLCYINSFAGPGFSKPLREEENVPSVAGSVPARSQRGSWNPSLDEGSILKRIIIFLEFSDLLCFEFVSHKIKDDKTLWSFYLEHQDIRWNREAKLWKKIVVSQRRMEEIAWKNPLNLSIKDREFVHLSTFLGHPVATHITRNYYFSKPEPQFYIYDESHFSLKAGYLNKYE